MNSRKYILSCKLFGGLYFIPYCIMILVPFYCILMKDNILIDDIIPSTFENVIPIFVAWWTIYSLYDLLEEDGGEVMFTYGIKKIKIGLLYTMRYFIWYIILWIPIMIGIMQFVLGNINYFIVVKIIFQSIFFWGFSFCTMALLKDVGWSFFVQFGYFFAAYFTNGEALGYLNIYSDQIADSDWSLIGENSIKCLVFALLFLAIGNYFINQDLLRGIRNVIKKINKLM